MKNKTMISKLTKKQKILSKEIEEIIGFLGLDYQNINIAEKEARIPVLRNMQLYPSFPYYKNITFW